MHSINIKATAFSDILLLSDRKGIWPERNPATMFHKVHFWGIWPTCSDSEKLAVKQQSEVAIQLRLLRDKWGGRTYL